MSRSGIRTPTRRARWPSPTKSSKRARLTRSVVSMPDKPPRLRPISPGTIADNVQAPEGISDEELVARLYAALRALPPAERAAAVVAIGYGEGAAGVAMELNL